MKTPDFTGVGDWKAWTAPLRPQTIDQQAALGLYLLHCPKAHAFWEYWFLHLTHLRDFPGAQPAYKQAPNNTHELIICTINPEKCPTPDPENPPWPHLSPPDLIVQFEVPNDVEAKQIAMLCVRQIMTGKVSPDQDFRSYWKEAIAATALHARQGKHPVQ